MKKLFLALIAMALPGLAFSAATATPTFTATLTRTPTATFTPSPVAAFDASNYREYTYPQSVWAGNGVVLASAVTTPLPGATAPWVAQVVSQTAFVMSTGSAQARWTYGIPGNYERKINLSNMNVWAYVATTATAQTITMTLNVSRNPMGNLYPQGGIVYPGTATSMTSQFTNSSITGKVLRVKLPLSSSARFQAGDQLNFDLRRSGGVTTDVYIYRLEVEYPDWPYHSH
jgi:hypothetical protein